MQETTPPPQPQQPKFTPSNRGSAAISEYIKAPSLRLSHLSPWIRRDVQTYQSCKFETMLKAILRRCSPGHDEPDQADLDELLQNCLAMVLPLCNEDTELRNYLAEYCKHMSLEKERYPPFVKFCNRALDILKSKELPELPHPATIADPRNVLFHVSDTTIIKCPHGGRKPDIVLVPLEAAENSANPDHRSDQWKDVNVITKTATSPPCTPFKWEDIILPLEFKMEKCKLKSPPDTYQIKEPKDFSPKSTPSDGFEQSSILTTSTILTNDASISGQDAKAATTSASRRSTKSTKAVPTSSNKKTSSGRVSESSRRSTRLKDKVSVSRSQHSAGTGSKRPSGSETAESSRKKPKLEEQKVKVHVNIQSAMYGAEILSHLKYSACAMSMVIVDSVVWIWWYDRQGAIQTHGLDFIEDLPHFMVLLSALQRLPKDWEKVHSPDSPVHLQELYGDMTLKLGKRLIKHWGIRGRATNLFSLEDVVCPPNIPPAVTKRLNNQAMVEQLSNNGMVGKLSWVESTRVLESDIILEILKRMADLSPEDRAAVEGHIPDLIASTTFSEHETKNIRKELGISVKDMENRVLILSIFRQLQPITELEGNEFWRAWWDCVLCHRVLWKMGVRHRDISAANLMYYRHEGRVMGVLNDFDLSTLTGPGVGESATGTDRTGTLPFMALELLESPALEGNVEHQYQHDFEAFLWVLVWITHRYQDGKEIPKPPFDSWIAQHEQCWERKSAYQLALVCGRPVREATSSHKPAWRCGKVLFFTTHIVKVMDEELPDVDSYFNRMKNVIKALGNDLEVNPF